MTGIRIIDLPQLGGVTDASEIVGSNGSSGHFTGAQLKAYINAAGASSGAIAAEAAARAAADAAEASARVIGDADVLTAVGNAVDIEAAARIAADAALQQTADALHQADLDQQADTAAHAADHTNPHQVTAAQVGAYSAPATDALLAGKAALSHDHAAADVTSGVFSTARLGSGTADATTFLRGDGAWAAGGTGGGVTSVAGKTGVVTLAAGDVTSGTFATARLGAGTADTTTYLRGDGNWVEVVTGGTGGDVSSVAGKVGVVVLEAADITSGAFATARLGSGTADTTVYLRGDGAWTAAPVSSVAGKTGTVTLAGSDIASGTVATARLGSGTPGASNYLRGDGAWTAAPVVSVAGKTGAVALAGGDIASGTVAPARLGSGTPSSSNYLRGDGTWTVAPTAPVTSVAGKTGAVVLAGADIASGTVAPARLGSGTPGSTNYLRGDGAWTAPTNTLGIAVEDYGAVGNGTTDDTAAIQAAINAAALVGGDVIFGAKTYKISSTLLIGDGSASAVSTYSGIRLVGTGIPPKPATMFSGYGALTKKVTYLRWSGAIGGTMLRIRGPLQGWGLQNLFFDGGNGLSDFGGRAGIGVEVISAMSGDNRNLTFSGCRIASIYLTTVPLITGVSITDAIHNSWDNINIGQGWADGSKAIVMTGATSTTNSNSDFNKFTNVTIALPGTMGAGQVGYGLYFQSCDSHSFTNVHFFNGDPSFPAMVFDYTVTDIWPAGNQIMGVDWGAIAAPIQQKGTPNVNARPNYITLVSECNGGFLPTGIANLTVDGHIMRTADIIGLTTSQVNKILWSPFRAGLYRLNYYAVVTGGNAGGGSITLSFAWNDGTGAHSVNSAIMLNGPGNYVSGVISMYVAVPSDIAWAATLSGINGTTVTTQYRVALAIDRMF